MPSSIAQKLKRLMKIGVVVDSDDSISYPVILVNYLGKVASRVVNFSPFGVWSRPSDGMMSMLFNMNGSESNKFGITNELKDRPIKNLKKGEVVLGNLLSHFHFKEDGSVSLFINNVEVLTIDTTGNMVFTGNITSAGVVEGSDFTNGATPYNTHKHVTSTDPSGPPIN